MAASTETVTYQDALDSQYLSSSLSSLSRSRSTNSLIVRTYKQATQLYLTKRFKEALETLEPIIQTKAEENGDGEAEQSGNSGAAPVAQSSKSTRTKVWVFYLSLLHAIVELGPEEGKLVFGSTRWRQLAAKARDGTVWEEVVQAGYGGNEGDVDADVVVNLATLLLGHMQNQKLNQQRLETWLSTSASADAGQHVSFADGTMSPVPNGSSSPKALASRLKILELYALHVLPANGEWGYATQFIEMNDTLDEERREAFLHTLQSIKEEQDGTALKERELAERREREMEQQRKDEEIRQVEQARQEEERRKATEAEKAKAATKSESPPVTPKATNSKPAQPNGHASKPSASRPPSKAQKKPPAPAPNFYRRASSMIGNLQQMVLQASRNMTGNSVAMFRLLMFVVAFLVLIARRDLRLRVRRALEEGWTKVRKTVGMGVKPSAVPLAYLISLLMDFIVGSFNHDLYTFRFEPPTKDSKASLNIIRPTPAIGGHSWLALSKDKKFLYCTAWTKPQPSIAAYRIKNNGREVEFLNAKHINALSGYVCCSATHIYSVGGPTGEVFRIASDGSIGELVQNLNFVDPEGVNVSEQRGSVPHGDFGGLRHGAHSVDLSPDGKSLYVADIGRNCIWTYSINNSPNASEPKLKIGSWTSPHPSTDGREPEPHLKLGSKHISPRSHDGPRHTWPHPSGKILYSLQEHSSMVDLFSVASDGVTLKHLSGVKIIPEDKDPKDYWADEVRFSTGPEPERPTYLYASTRGLKPETKGYIAVFRLYDDGTLESERAVAIWETPTSGGIANAIEPAPWRKEFKDVEYLALTDSEEGWVSIIAFDEGEGMREVAKVNLGKTDDGEVVGAATAVWL